MRVWFTVTMCAALVALGNLPFPLLAQQKTVKACQDEWRANKADNQAKGITEKAYVAQCRTGGQPTSAPTAIPAPPSAASPAPKKTVKACQDEWRANKAAYQAARITEKAYVDKCRAGEAVALPSTPAASPTEPTATVPSAASPAPKKTVKACQDEWRANRPAYQAARITEKAYVDKCRTGEAVALPSTPAGVPTPAPAAPPTPDSTTASPAPAPTATPEVRSPPTRPTPAGAGQFQTEAQAKSKCPADLVVWVNLTSKIYHFAGHRSYGTTKAGAYMCEKEATAQGFRASKTERRPST